MYALGTTLHSCRQCRFPGFIGLLSGRGRGRGETPVCWTSQPRLWGCRQIGTEALHHNVVEAPRRLLGWMLMLPQVRTCTRLRPSRLPSVLHTAHRVCSYWSRVCGSQSCLSIIRLWHRLASVPCSAHMLRPNLLLHGCGVGSGCCWQLAR